MNRIYTLAFVVLISLTACQPDERTLAPAGSKLEGINATWVLDKVISTDSTTEIKIDITSYYLQDNLVPELVMNSENLSYTFNAQGKKNYLGTSGTWKFDDDEAPTNIELVNENNETVLLNLHKTIRPVDQTLAVQLVRYCGETPRAVYSYFFKRKAE
ncbi:MAG: DUF5004 domain-containing protein [Bacteroidetes bacterium]|nr:DUF5004 domain-containing protein [Bacteroidota bacterium]